MERALAICLAACGLAAGAQDKPRVKKAEDKRVDQAIARGVEYLKRAGSPGRGHSNGHELILWTFLHAGLSEKDPYFQRLFKEMMSSDLALTYNVSLQAMLLEELDRAKYQLRIYQCAQFLVDNQATNGGWGYGEPTQYDKIAPVIATSGSGRVKVKPGTKPPVVRTITVKRKRNGQWNDYSNSQYAALGLRACHDAGVVIPPDTIEAAVNCWRRGQRPDRGWAYYDDQGESSGSMTAGAVGSLAIYDYIRDGDRKTWKTDKNVLDGVEWMSRNFSVAQNPGKGKNGMYYYYLYGLERAGVLFGTERFGRHEWYAEGAKVLLSSQRPDGSWEQAGEEGGHAEWDTCFAILFLRRATQPLEYIVTPSGRRFEMPAPDGEPIIVEPIDEKR